MKLKFKQQAYQTHAVQAVVDCFTGQPKNAGITYRIDPGRQGKQAPLNLEEAGLKNSDLAIPIAQILANIHSVQFRQNLSLPGPPLRFDPGYIHFAPLELGLCANFAKLAWRVGCGGGWGRPCGCEFGWSRGVGV